MSALSPLFSPKGIAVVGASADPEKAGHVLLRVLSGYPGPLYPVNPRGGEILGLPAVPRVAEVSGADLAILAVPPEAVPAALAECVGAGIRAAVIVAGGFAEIGSGGRDLQRDATRIAAEGGVRLLGPNTSGFMNPGAGVFASFVPAAATLKPGPVAVVAQSGGVNHALAFALHAEGVGLSLAVGLGNAADVGVADVLDHLALDPSTRAVALHVEGVEDGRALAEAVARVTRRLPVAALVVGRADVGDFAHSHTGALSASWAVTRAALEQAGAVLVDDSTELVDAAAALAVRRLEPAAQTRIGVVTAQAGPGLLLTDALRDRGLVVPELTTVTRRRLSELLPPLTYQRNPVDTGRPAATFREVLDAVVSDPLIDATIVYALAEPDAFDPLTLASSDPLPAVFATSGQRDEIAPTAAALRGVGIAVAVAPERGAHVLAALVADARVRARRLRHSDDVASVPAIDLPPGALDEHRAKGVLDTLGIPTPRRYACNGRQEAHRAADHLARPLVVKVLDAGVLHKTEVGGVHLDITDAAGLDCALDAIGAARVLVEEQASPGVELLVGARRDDAFGPIVLVGFGGTMAEALGDVAIRLAPVSRAEARGMLDELRLGALLDGFRGLPTVDRDDLAGVIVTLGGFLAANEAVEEIEINPLRATSGGLVALDCVLTRRSL